MLSLWKEALKNIFFPRICFICEKPISTGFICKSCYGKIKFLNPPLCKMCSTPIPGETNRVCKRCKNKLFFYDQLISTTVYAQPLISLLHLFKYKQNFFLKDLFSYIIVTHLKSIGFEVNEYDFILSVPAHPLRMREREYNQTELLGKDVAEYLNLPFRKDILYCTKDHKSQTKVPLEKRVLNIQGVFYAEKDISGKNVILIDDVVTTSATVSECSKVLKQKGARKITVITLAKAR